jgi:hypothetical protein
MIDLVGGDGEPVSDSCQRTLNLNGTEISI